MRLQIKLFYFCFFLFSVQCHSEFNPFSESFIVLLNSRNSTWKAGKNFDVHTSRRKVENLMGVHPNHKIMTLPKQHHQVPKSLPESFDSRIEWDNCPSLSNIRDQSTCGSCWAFATVEAITDRICIHSKGAEKPIISAEDLLTCCTSCGYGCNGGFPSVAWQYWMESGITTGGDYNTTEGCKSYSFPSCEHHTEGKKPQCGPSKPTPPCHKFCDKDKGPAYEETLSFGKIVYGIENDVIQIQSEIMRNGPVGATFIVYDDLLSYKSGVYQHLAGEALGGHAVKIIGWGVENGIDYWTIANSWNEDWGEKGYFKILRGVNECGIEEYIIAGLPNI